MFTYVSTEQLWMKEKRIRQTYEEQINQILHSIHSYDQTRRNTHGDAITADDVLADIIYILTNNVQQSYQPTTANIN